MTLTTAAVVYLLSILVVILLGRTSQRLLVAGPRLPPGPRPLPFVGNLFDLTLKEFWIRVTLWAERYGDLVHIHILGQHVLYLSSFEAIHDLFDKGGAIYSDRPQTVMSTELCGCDRIIAFTPYGEWFRRQRKLLHTALSPPSIQTYQPTLTAETHILMERLLDSSSDSAGVLRAYTGGQVLSIVYGYRITGDDDPHLKKAEEVLHIISNHILSLKSGLWLVDIFPFLKYLPTWCPGAGFKSTAAKWRAEMEDCAAGPFQWVKANMERGTATPCYCTMLLNEHSEHGDTAARAMAEFDIQWTANAMYIASVDTILTVIDHFFLAMVQHPEVVRRAHEELDAVTRSARLPNPDDRPALPYIEAIMNECLRWTVPAPLGIPRRLTQDDVYRGMSIPKGTLVFANMWKLSRDPGLFPNPGEFIPERYLDEVDEATAKRRDPRNFVFGFGRRRCAGVHLVDAQLWLVIACALATFDFCKAVDASGTVLEPAVRYDDPTLRMPSAFPCNIRPRSERAAKLVHEAVAAQQGGQS